MILGWRAWYMDGEVYSSADVGHGGLPGDKLLGIVEYLSFETPKRVLHTGHDWYFFWHGPRGLVIGGNSDPLEENERRYPGATFIRGHWTTHDEMREVRQEMQDAHKAP